MENKFFFYIWRKKKIVIPIATIIAIIIIGILLVNLEKNRAYDTYRVISSVDSNDDGTFHYFKYKDGVVRYNPEGLSYYAGGKEIFNKAFQMTAPVIDVNGDYIVFGDRNTTNISLFDGEGKEYNITATCAVVGVTVSKKGVVAAILDDGTANYIELYDKEGVRLVSGRTVVEGDGYPVSIAISDDSEKLIASYLAVSEGKAHSKVVFYNYSSVGENEVDRVVGGFNQYEDTLVPKVKFINNTTAVAIGDEMFSIYSIDEKPELIYEDKVTEKIEKVFYSTEYIGMVLKDSQKAGNYIIKVYNQNGKMVCNKNTDFAIEGIRFAGNNVVVFNNAICQMYSFRGKNRFNNSFDARIIDIQPISDKQYIAIIEGKIEEIKLK